MAYTFVRTSELIECEWPEFDLDNARWDIPAAHEDGYAACCSLVTAGDRDSPRAQTAYRKRQACIPWRER
jgi:hypothetical protein